MKKPLSSDMLFYNRFRIYPGGISLMCIVTPYDSLYWSIAIESESVAIVATDE